MRFPTYILLLSANVVLVRRPVVASSPGNGPGKYIDPYPRSLSDEKITSPVGSTLEREVDNVKLKMPEDEPGRATSRKALPTEVEKLHRQRGHPGPANRKWAQCMDECLPELEATEVDATAEVLRWRRVMHYRLCSWKRCAAHDQRRKPDLAINKGRKAENWLVCMDRCGAYVAFAQSSEFAAVDAEATLAQCQGQCAAFGPDRDGEDRSYTPTKLTRQQVFGDPRFYPDSMYSSVMKLPEFIRQIPGAIRFQKPPRGILGGGARRLRFGL